ncbi:MAG: hypothetical protein ACKO7U_05235, partial [Actinomycetota bacterium]
AIATEPVPSTNATTGAPSTIVVSVTQRGVHAAAGAIGFTRHAPGPPSADALIRDDGRKWRRL